MGEKVKKFRYFALIGILLVFLVIAAILMLERAGVQPGDVKAETRILDRGDVIRLEDAIKEEPSDCLVITDLGREDCVEAYGELSVMLLDMKVPCDVVDLGSEAVPDDLTKYETFVIVTPDIGAIGERITDICARVYEGAGMLVTMVPELDSYGEYLLQKAGCFSYSYDYVEVDSIYFDKDFLIGGGAKYDVPTPFESSVAVSLRDDARVVARSGSEKGLPVIWSHDYGEGTIAVDNIGIYEKAFRGFYSMSYTLIEDVSLYPVLDGMVIFLDDMPSPVPEGISEYIERDYHVSISDYYVNYWYPDIHKLSVKYGFPLVGLIIENYGKDVDGTDERQPDTSRFTYFGNQILRDGGEIGYHGYNHQPLSCTIDYGDLFEYTHWDSTEAIKTSFEELIDFTEDLYPGAAVTCYVPPSNIMSADGREYIGSLYPKVRTISGIYFDSDEYDYSYTTEFCVAEDGIVEMPRITSGSLIDDYMQIAALSELNMHMVFSHFIHPDDAMDVDRGAEIGWPTLYKNLDKFFGWVVESAPAIRRVDSATLSGTLQRWSSLTVDKKWKETDTKNILTVKLGNYLDEAHLMYRFNKGVPDKISGGTVTQITDSLYLIDADCDTIVMEWSK